MKSDLYLKKYVMDIENSGVRPVKIFIHMYKYSHKVDSVHPDIVLPLGDTSSIIQSTSSVSTLKTLHPEEHNLFSGIFLPRRLSMHQDSIV